MSANPLNAGTPNCMVVWVMFIPLSENRIRRMHWSKVHRHNEDALRAWGLSLRSLSAEDACLMTTIRKAVEQKDFEMLLLEVSESTMEIQGLSGNTLRPKQMDNKGVS